MDALIKVLLKFHPGHCFVTPTALGSKTPAFLARVLCDTNHSIPTSTDSGTLPLLLLHQSSCFEPLISTHMGFHWSLMKCQVCQMLKSTCASVWEADKCDKESVFDSLGMRPGWNSIGIGLLGSPMLFIFVLSRESSCLGEWSILSSVSHLGLQMCQDAAGFSQPGGAMMKGSGSRWQTSPWDSAWWG